MFKTKEYNEWIAEATAQLNPQYPGSILGPYKLSIQIRRGSRADLDNLEKPTNDLLQRCGVIENDKHLEMSTKRWVSDGYDGMYVRVEPAGIE